MLHISDQHHHHHQQHQRFIILPAVLAPASLLQPILESVHPRLSLPLTRQAVITIQVVSYFFFFSLSTTYILYTVRLSFTLNNILSHSYHFYKLNNNYYHVLICVPLIISRLLALFHLFLDVLLICAHTISMHDIETLVFYLVMGFDVGYIG